MVIPLKKIGCFATVVAMTAFFSPIAIAQTADVDGSEFRSDDQGNWYHPVEPHSWVHVGSKLDVIEATLERIGSAKGAREHGDQPDTIMEFGPGNWIYEWSQVGETTLLEAKNAEAAGNASLAKAKYQEAASYFVRASSPHTNKPKALDALAKAQSAYRNAGRFLPVPLQEHDVPYEGKTFRANLHLPEGEGPFPLVVMSFGSDVSKEEGLPFFEKQLSLRKIALLMIDMPGMGESRNWVITPDIDKLHAAAVDYARTLSVVDSKNVFVMGASFGGAPAARIFLAREELDLAGVVYVCGLLHSPYMAPPQVIAQFPQFSLDGVRTRLGLELNADHAKIGEKLKPLSMIKQGLMGGDHPNKIQTPLLVLTTHQDPSVPLQDVALLLDRAENAKAIIYHEPGHCPDRDSREAAAASWIVDKLRD